MYTTHDVSGWSHAVDRTGKCGLVANPRIVTLHTRLNTSTGGHAVGMGDYGVDGASCAYRDTQKAPVAFDY